MPRSKPSPGEFALIETIRRHFSGIPAPGVTLGIGDDCAILAPPPASDLLVTTDLLLEGRHFRRDLHPAASAGHRCLARGLSDLAAMGATPFAAFLSLALPPQTLRTGPDRRWLQGFLRGMAALARRTPVPLAGGDTGALAAPARGEDFSPNLAADIVLLGHAPRGTAMRRDQARPGDRLFVTGTLGGAAAELERMLAGAPPLPRSHSPQRFPVPRLAAGHALRELGVRAAIDLSDGLSGDLPHLARASRVRAVVDAAALPLHPLARAHAAPLQLALSGGEDYELLFAVPSTLRIPRRITGVAFTEIGLLLPPRRGQPLVTLRHADGREEPLAPGAWEHFTPRGRR